MYNYFASGESDSYSFARETYPIFVAADDPDTQYERYDDRIGYVVVNEPLGSTLTDGSDGQHLGHYRALYASDDVVGYVVVPGAQIERTGTPGTNMTVETAVSIDGASFTYERETTVDDDGTYTVTVAYPGEYAVGNESVRVTEADVESGSSIVVRSEGAE
ncbi:hypothetical protein [Halorubrum ezzemoulense]|uniref:Archaeal glycosylation protein B peripheral domain-containing protein n=1 Tax=Halorubrum ezzemoulense TaxID=337243 RepID=A0A256JFN9_HALEZ|nr:hypothetical protein [Halorubrum ezzemoulense]OYR67222.1 hypothetical protein DJ78_16260 [Halorubrum ezzemoulense]